MTSFSCLLCFVRTFFDYSIGVPISVLGTVSVALGLLLGFRVNTAYDRYWEGRKLMQTVMGTIRNVARQIWINIPENTEQDHVEKMRVVKLLLAFFVATCHHLRGEFGVHHDDLKYLLPPNWEPMSVSRKKSNSVRAGIKPDTAAPLHTHSEEEAANDASCSDKALETAISKQMQAGHHPYMEADEPTDISNLRRALIEQEFPNTGFAQASSAFLRRHSSKTDLQSTSELFKPQETTRLIGTEDTRGYDALKKKAKDTVHSAKDAIIYNRFRAQGRNVVKRHLDHSHFTHEEDLPYQGDSDLSLPLEILFRVALYVNEAKLAKKIESPLVSTTTNSIDSLVNSLTAFERILHTPIPKAYNIHLKQAVLLYIFFLPFALVETMGWLVAPVVAIVSFTLFGILSIGSEIENPFGYDDNDLPLDKYSADLKKEVEYIIYHIPTKTTSILLDGH
ncbi:Bestrophin, RFP-TM, chloride channel-domain-containing protein [Pilobolus umbonatus]|nr:Bestrophin, RFP-TM, chloride channel-domain-containing protein [Pilobolus umbonatus]